MYTLSLNNFVIWQKLLFHSSTEQEYHSSEIITKYNHKSTHNLETLTSSETIIHSEKDGLIWQQKSIHRGYGSKSLVSSPRENLRRQCREQVAHSNIK
jgi:hypothetical protein